MSLKRGGTVPLGQRKVESRHEVFAVEAHSVHLVVALVEEVSVLGVVVRLRIFLYIIEVELERRVAAAAFFGEHGDVGFLRRQPQGVALAVELGVERVHTTLQVVIKLELGVEELSGERRRVCARRC